MGAMNSTTLTNPDSTSSTPLRIDFVSDVSCPWCAVGLGALQAALARVAPGITAELHFQPFELNPQLGAAVGFTFDPDRRSRVWNTFDAHRLLHWAEMQGAALQLALKKALLKAYLTDGENPSDPEVLVRLAGQAGLDTEQARAVLVSGEFTDATRQREQDFLDAGIRSVPAIILDRKHLISGGQPVEVFERALRQVAGMAHSAPADGATRTA